MFFHYSVIPVLENIVEALFHHTGSWILNSISRSWKNNVYPPIVCSYFRWRPSTVMPMNGLTPTHKATSADPRKVLWSVLNAFLVSTLLPMNAQLQILSPNAIKWRTLNAGGGSRARSMPIESFEYSPLKSTKSQFSPKKTIFLGNFKSTFKDFKQPPSPTPFHIKMAQSISL